MPVGDRRTCFPTRIERLLSEGRGRGGKQKNFPLPPVKKKQAGQRDTHKMFLIHNSFKQAKLNHPNSTTAFVHHALEAQHPDLSHNKRHLFLQQLSLRSSLQARIAPLGCLSLSLAPLWAFRSFSASFSRSFANAVSSTS